MPSFPEIDSIETMSRWKERKGEALMTSYRELWLTEEVVVVNPRGTCDAGCGAAAERAALTRKRRDFMSTIRLRILRNKSN